MNKLVLLSGILLLIPLYAYADSHPNLIVSAENPAFGNHFSGSMVVEVIVSDPSLSDTSVGKGEPDVTINGNNLRMVQATDGRWYAYFANVDKAKAADQIVQSAGAGAEGEGLDFGVFCSKDTTSLGPSFSDTDGIAVPRSMTGATNGNTAFATCTGSPSGTILDNVVRSPRSINAYSDIPSGQIGLDTNAWPLIQLFSFSNNVVIQYNGVGTQSVTLVYDDMPNVSLSLDRNNYPPSSHVFATINDMQLNQDPTSRDSWTFNISPQTVFYEAFRESGATAADGAGLVNLIPSLSTLGFEKNGKLSMNLGTVAELIQNDFQQSSASDGTTTYTNFVTFVETQPNSGIFENADDSSQSNIRIKSNAPRGQSATIEYNSKSYSIVSGLNTATMSFGTAQVLPGQRIPLTVTDSDQNINPASRDKLDVFRSSALIPSLTIGNPITLEDAGSVKFYTSSTDNLSTLGTSITSTVPDRNSARLVLDSASSAPLSFEKISLGLGVTADDLKNALINTSDSNTSGTNWINYDLRSIQNELGITDFTDTRISLFFGLSDSSPVTLLSAGRLTGAQGLIQNDTAVSLISSKSGQAFLVIDFDASNNSSPPGNVQSGVNKQPIVFDLFSFGEKNGVQVNNAIYRFELKETGLNTGTFTGTLEYVVANQLNQFDANTIKSLSTISDNVKFFVNQRLVDEKGINIAYSDVARVGLTVSTSVKTDIATHSGTVSLNSKTFRFGQPVTVRLNDPDLNAKHDEIDIYSVINDPNSSDVDTVGSSSGGKMLEVLIKGIRYKRCTIDGVETGGLASTGFSLVETGPNTGIFEGVFKMPSWICNKDGTALISPAGGVIDLKYTDFRDASGQQNTFSLSNPQTKQSPSPPVKQDSKPIPKPQTPANQMTETAKPAKNTLSPLKQIKAGYAPTDVECRKGFELIMRSNGMPACVYPSTAELLRSLGMVAPK